MKYLEIKAPAKINIGLNIIEKRNDGFHNLITLFYTLNQLYDTIQFYKSDNFEFTTDNTILLKEKNNIIKRAHDLLQDYTKKKLKVQIYLSKRIPLGAGLGGGSSNAAATLVSLNKMFSLKLKWDELSKLALQLGSDVPYFLRAKPAIGKLRGEELTLTQYEIKLPILIINPGIHISTKDAFQNIIPASTDFDYEDFLLNPDLDFRFMRRNIKNDFENYVFSKFPEIKGIKERMYLSGADFALMSGTGSTVYGIFPNTTAAKMALDLFPPHYFKHLEEYSN